MKKYLSVNIFILVFLLLGGGIVTIHSQDKKDNPDRNEHESNVYGVTIGMDVPTALQTVFVNANRQPGQEKPDAKRNEGKDKRYSGGL